MTNKNLDANALSEGEIKNIDENNIDSTSANKEINKPAENENISENEDNKSVTCNICLDKITSGKILNCGHIFHLRCIK